MTSSPEPTPRPPARASRSAASGSSKKTGAKASPGKSSEEARKAERALATKRREVIRRLHKQKKAQGKPPTAPKPKAKPKAKPKDPDELVAAMAELDDDMARVFKERGHASTDMPEFARQHSRITEILASARRMDLTEKYGRRFDEANARYRQIDPRQVEAVRSALLTTARGDLGSIISASLAKELVPEALEGKMGTQIQRLARARWESYRNAAVRHLEDLKLTKNYEEGRRFVSGLRYDLPRLEIDVTQWAETFEQMSKEYSHALLTLSSLRGTRPYAYQRSISQQLFALEWFTDRDLPEFERLIARTATDLDGMSYGELLMLKSAESPLKKKRAELVEKHDALLDGGRGIERSYEGAVREARTLRKALPEDDVKAVEKLLSQQRTKQSKLPGVPYLFSVEANVDLEILRREQRYAAKEAAARRLYKSLDAVEHRLRAEVATSRTAETKAAVLQRHALELNQGLWDIANMPGLSPGIPQLGHVYVEESVERAQAAVKRNSRKLVKGHEEQLRLVGRVDELRRTKLHKKDPNTMIYQAPLVVEEASAAKSRRYKELKRGRFVSNPMDWDRVVVPQLLSASDEYAKRLVKEQTRIRKTAIFVRPPEVTAGATRR